MDLVAQKEPLTHLQVPAPDCRLTRRVICGKPDMTVYRPVYL